MSVIAQRDCDHYVLNGRKYWPCNVAGWDGQGANEKGYTIWAS